MSISNVFNHVHVNVDHRVHVRVVSLFNVHVRVPSLFPFSFMSMSNPCFGTMSVYVKMGMDMDMDMDGLLGQGHAEGTWTCMAT
jgi:hypothetical protein